MIPDQLHERIVRQLALPAEAVRIVRLTPLIEGATVELWVGFRHFNYLMEQAVSVALREHDADMRGLYWGERLCSQFSGSRMRYLQALLFGDDVYACVQAELRAGPAVSFRTHLVAERFGAVVPLARGTLELRLFEKDGRMATTLPPRLLAAIGGGSSFSDGGDDRVASMAS